MRNLRALFSISIFALTTMQACKFGKNAANLDIARLPLGTMAQLNAAGRNMESELLDARADGLVVKNGIQIMFVSYRNIRSFKPSMLPSDYSLAGGEQPSALKISRLRSISHFPQGMTPEIERRYLEAAQQREVITLQ